MNNIKQQLNRGVLVLTFDRLEKKNALNQQMYRFLTQALLDAKSDENVKVVLLQGGAECFTAGNDLQDFVNAGALDTNHPTVQFLYQLATFNKPLIAAVSGVAIGIGTTALLHCDLVYAADNAKFQLPFTQLGLCPEAASSLLLPKLVGYHKAAQYLLLGESFNAQTAADMGLVNQVVDINDLTDFAFSKACTLAAMPAEAVQISRALLKRHYHGLTEQTIAAELIEFERLLNTTACQQRIAGFLKR